MKQLMFLAAAVFACAEVCAAAPCVAGSLASYVALGAGGCTIGTNTLFSFQVLSGINFATQISPSAVAIAPLGGTFDPGISATLNLSANAGSLLETMFTYKISGNSYTRDVITLSNSSSSGDGAVTDIQDLCVGGSFGSSGVTGCTGSARSLLTLAGTQNQDSNTFNAASLLSVTDDFTLDGGLAGSASGGTITDRFTAVPEPSAFLLTAFATALAAGFKFRRTK